jgi:hypothetical protein
MPLDQEGTMERDEVTKKRQSEETDPTRKSDQEREEYPYSEYPYSVTAWAEIFARRHGVC